MRLHYPLPQPSLTGLPVPFIARKTRDPVLPESHSGQGFDPRWDLQAQLGALPTKTDMEKYISRLEDTTKKAVKDLKHELHQVGARVHKVENTIDTVHDCVDKHHDILHHHATQLQDFLYHIDDIENR